MDQAMFESTLKREGYDQVEVGGRPPNDKSAAHAHHFDVAALVLSGAITLTCDDQQRTYKAGDVFRLAAGTMHAEDVGTDGVRYVVGRRH